MPLYDYVCKNCRYETSHNIKAVDRNTIISCSKCGEPLKRLFPTKTHTKIGSSVDSIDSGKVTKEKNEQLKRKWSGYKNEEQNLRSELTDMANKKLSNYGKSCNAITQ